MEAQASPKSQARIIIRDELYPLNNPLFGQSQMRGTRSIIVHGGAGSGKFTAVDPRFRELGRAVEVGMSAMRKGSSLDGVVEAVNYMEECGRFNAGKGACLTIDGRVQLDAAVALGKGQRGAGVGVCDCTYHPVKLARYVMEETDHVLIAGDDCKSLARAAGMTVEVPIPSPSAREKYRILEKDLGRIHPKHLRFANASDAAGTVGAVALDHDGVPSAAVSTGGMWLKLPGRIGDSAILGAGVFADKNTGAACATGSGEAIIRSAMCWNACALLKEFDAGAAARKAVNLLSRKNGKNTAGIITVDLSGRVGFAYNTEAMGRAWYDLERERAVVRI